MKTELKLLIQKIIKISLAIILPASALVYLIWGPMAMLALFSGGFLAVAGFILSVISADYALSGGGSIFATVAVHFFKVITTALVAWLLVRHQAFLGIFFGVGYSVLIAAVMVYTKGLN